MIARTRYRQIMAKNVLFLIHGVGRNGASWVDAPDGPIATLQAASQRYAFFKGRNLRDLVDFVPILYDDLFSQMLGQWQDMAKGLGGVAGAAPDALKMLLDLQTKYSDDTKTLVAFGGDVPLYRGFRLFAQRVQLRVILRIAEAVAARSAASEGDAPQFVVLAHSLGTTVAHDSLHLLGSSDWLTDDMAAGPCGASEDAQAYKAANEHVQDLKKVLNPFAPGYLAFRSIFMLSNTSALLKTVCPPDSSLVCPIQRSGAAAAYCQALYNVDHVLDPISKILPFSVPDAWKPAGRNVQVDHLYDPNIHAFTHYLLNPKVHIPLLKNLVNDFEPTDEEKAAAKVFPRFGGALQNMAEAAKADLENRLKTIIVKAAEPGLAELRRWRNVYDDLNDVSAQGI